jgi:chlorobactene glucosyltransferase
MEWLLLPLVLSVVMIAINARLLPSLAAYETQPLHNTPKVSLLIPARNEAKNLPRLLPSLLAQDYPNLEILLLDDHSTDETLAVAEQFADPRLRVLQGGELLAGWFGKPNACRQLAQAATGEVLIFTDADTFWQPHAVSRTVKALESMQADALCAWPKQLFSGWVCTLVQPLTIFGIVLILPTWRILSDPNPFLVSANGQMLTFKRACLEQIGGFEAVKSSILEDIELARLVKISGMRFGLLSGATDIECRMYTGNREALRGFSKNVFAGLGYSYLRLVVQFVALLLLFTAPLVWLVSALLNNQPWQAAALAVFLGVLGRFIADRKFGFAGWLCLLQPFSVLMFLYIALVSVWRYHTGRNHWKGRMYDLRDF